MRRFAPVLGAALVVAAATIAQAGDKGKERTAQATEKGKEQATLAIGARAPMTDVKMTNVDGKAVTIAGAKGEKGTLVVFTCNSCPWAQAWEDRVASIGNAWAKKGIGVIAINPNDPAVKAEDGMAEMKARAKKLGLQFAYAVDGTSDIARAFGATRTPEVFLFDADGKLVYHGAIDDNAREPGKVTERYLEDALQAVSAGETIEVAETKAFGCTIKFRGKEAKGKKEA